MKLAKRIVRGVLRRGKKPYHKVVSPVQRKGYQKLYEECCKQPVEQNRVLFVDNRSSVFPDNMEAIKGELEQRGGFEMISLVRDMRQQPASEQKKYIQEFMREFARAQYVYLVDYFAPLYMVKKRPETVVVQLWHACGAFKKWGYSVLDEGFGKTRQEVEKSPIHTNYSFATVSSQQVAPNYAEAFNMLDRIEDVRATGVARTDVFFRPEYIKEARERFDSLFPQAQGKKVILYAPTYRGSIKKPKTDLPIHIPFLSEKLGEEYVLAIKLHPFVPPEEYRIPEEYSGFAKNLSASMEINQLLCVADVCVTDYSSIVFEYSLFEKPMIFYAYDKEEYIDSRGFYYPYEEFIPGPLVEDEQQLVEAILQTGEDWDPQVVKAFKEKFMDACDGHSSSRIVDETLGNVTLHPRTLSNGDIA